MTQREALKKNKQIKNSVRIMLCTAGEWLIDSVTYGQNGRGLADESNKGRKRTCGWFDDSNCSVYIVFSFIVVFSFIIGFRV